MKELKCFRRDEMMQVQNLDSLCSDRPRAPVLPSAITLQPFTPSTVQPFNPFNSSLITGHQSVEPSPASHPARDQFQLLAPVPKNIFLKNEAKLCPSLLRILKKRTQNEAK
jgi:hypothetical protein